MKQVLIAIPKGRDWLAGFTVSLLGLFLFEQAYSDYEFHLALAENRTATEITPENKHQVIAVNRTKLVNEALAGQYDYLLFLDDDMVFPVNAFRRLASHHQPFVSGLAFTKKPPFNPTILQAVTRREADGIHQRYEPIGEWGHELLPVDAVGLFCALIEVDAIKQLRTPWFSAPELAADSRIGEDVAFCRRFWEAGIPMYCDPDVKVGHLDGEHLITELDFLAYKEQRDKT